MDSRNRNVNTIQQVINITHIQFIQKNLIQHVHTTISYSPLIQHADTTRKSKSSNKSKLISKKRKIKTSFS